MTRTLLLLLGAPALILLLVYFLQRFLIYLPSGQVPPVSRILPGAEEVHFNTSDGLRLAGWFLPSESEVPGPAVLIANGNAGNRAHRAPLAEALHGMGVSVLLFDYRGFGGNPGTPSEKGLHRDALAAQEYLAGRPEVDAGRVVYFGESIGCAVLVNLAAERPPAGMVLRSPFKSLADVGRLHYPWLPVRLLLKDRYRVAETVSRVDVPLLVIAGERDSIVPAGQSRAVYDAALGNKEFLRVEGADHNDPALFTGEQLLAAVRSFLSQTVAARGR
ncbi:MAG TPA: alpha/beta hydrolase [Actinomycetota bacterium]|nr:alpha/beta hydrolase [Actinomycetota bacterium]